MVNTNAWRFFLPILLLAVFTAPSHAGTLFLSGNLRTDANVTDCGPGCTLGPLDTDDAYAQWAAVVTQFTIATGGPVQAITYGFGGGVSLGGHVVASGGFEPYLSLFDAGGNLLASTYFGTTCPAGANSYLGNCYDVELNAGVLSAGTYFLALTAYENMSFAENLGTGTLADGFTGLGSLGPGEGLDYAVDLVLPAGAVPEPGTGLLLTAGIALAAVLRKFQ